jgi:hypothetical protein
MRLCLKVCAVGLAKCELSCEKKRKDKKKSEKNQKKTKLVPGLQYAEHEVFLSSHQTEHKKMTLVFYMRLMSAIRTMYVAYNLRANCKLVFLLRIAMRPQLRGGVIFILNVI